MFNKSDIMKHAWNMFRKAAKSNWKFSTCLKRAWKAAKEKTAKAAGRVMCEAVKTTEKAYMLTARLVCHATDQSREVSVWLPKSQVKDGVVSDWILDQKAGELKARYSKYNASLCVYGVTKSPFYI